MITAALKGDTKVIQLFDEDHLPQQYYDAILGVVTETTEKMEATAKSLAPSKSGDLRAGIDSGVSKGANFIKGRVWSMGGAKAVALEYGATGRTKTQVLPHQQSLNHAWAKAISPIRVSVPAYTRVQNIAPHPFMRPALDAVSGGYAAAIAEVLDTVTAKANAEIAA